MKKILLALFGLFCVFSLVGCGEKDPVVPTLTAYEQEIKDNFDTIIPDEVTEHLELDKYYDFEDGTSAILSWETSNERTISNKGRYSQNLFDEEITVKAKVSFDNGDKDYEYSKVVKTTGKENVEEYKKIIESYLPDYVYKDFELVTRDLTYKKYNLFGIITYTPEDDSMLKVVENKEVVDDKEVITTVCKYVNTKSENQDSKLNYTVEINGIKVTGSKAITIEGRNDIKYISEAKAFLEKYFTTDLIADRIDLPLTDANERVNITWKSSDITVATDDGILYMLQPNKKVTFTATINYNGTIETWEKEFHTYNGDELMDAIMQRIHKDVIQQFVMEVFYYDTDNYGFMPFYHQDLNMHNVVTDTTPGNKQINYVKNNTNNTNVNNLEVETGLVPWENKGRPQVAKKYTGVITVHDTGSKMSASQWNELEKTNDDRETSWNFTVGEDKIYQHIPINEVAWHAGDGRTEFSLRDTGVKFEGYDPEITLGENVLLINGKESKIAIPWNGDNKANKISGAGLYTCLGENGNYWMADVFASSYSYASKIYYVCTKGGNRTGIGIETDIHKGVDYNQVLRNCSNLVGNLLVYFDLPCDRILQHRNFSGKLCPQVMIENNMWDDFFSMCQTEYLIKKYLNDLKVEYTTSDETLLSKTGKVLKKVDHDTEVTYTAKATANGVTKEYTFKTTIKPIVK